MAGLTTGLYHMTSRREKRCSERPLFSLREPSSFVAAVRRRSRRLDLPQGPHAYFERRSKTDVSAPHALATSKHTRTSCGAKACSWRRTTERDTAGSQHRGRAGSGCDDGHSRSSTSWRLRFGWNAASVTAADHGAMDRRIQDAEEWSVMTDTFARIRRQTVRRSMARGLLVREASVLTPSCSPAGLRHAVPGIRSSG